MSFVWLNSFKKSYKLYKKYLNKKILKLVLLKVKFLDLFIMIVYFLLQTMKKKINKSW